MQIPNVGAALAAIPTLLVRRVSRPGALLEDAVSGWEIALGLDSRLRGNDKCFDPLESIPSILYPSLQMLIF